VAGGKTVSGRDQRDDSLAGLILIGKFFLSHILSESENKGESTMKNDKNGTNASNRTNPGRCFLVQFRHPDEGTWCDMCFPSVIIEHLGYRDCSGCEIEVYDVHEFGKVVKLVEDANISWPSNYHRLVNEATGEVVIEGYSQEH
jgi:hypothetical protein